MIPHLFYYQLTVLGLLWFFLMRLPSGPAQVGRVPTPCGEIPQAHLSTVTGAQRLRHKGSPALPVALAPLVPPSPRAGWTPLAGSGLPPLAASPHHGWLPPPRAAAPAGPATAAPRAASRRAPSGQRPWPASGAASAGPRRCQASAPPGAAGGGRARAGSKPDRTRATRPAAGGRRPPPCPAWRPGVPPPPQAAGGAGCRAMQAVWLCPPSGASPCGTASRGPHPTRGVLAPRGQCRTGLPPCA
jgi:WAS/WASL-interacting protein